MERNQLDDFKNFLEWQIETAPFHFEVDPYKEAYYNMYDVYTAFKKINNPGFPSSCKLYIDIEIKEELFQAPIYLLTDENQNVLKMKISDEEYDVKMEDNNITILNKSLKKSYNMQSYLFKYQDIEIVKK